MCSITVASTVSAASAGALYLIADAGTAGATVATVVVGAGAVYITVPSRRTDGVTEFAIARTEQNAAQQRCHSRKRVLISVTHGHGAIADTTNHAETNQSRLFNLVKAAQSVQSALVVARILHDDCLRLRLAY